MKILHTKFTHYLRNMHALLIFMPPDRMIGAYCFCPVCLSVCLFVCLSVCLLSTLTFAITFEPLEVETSYLACILH